MSPPHTHDIRAQLRSRNPSHLSILTHAQRVYVHVRRHGHKVRTFWRVFWIGLLHRPQTCTDAFIRARYIYHEQSSAVFFRSSLPSLSFVSRRLPSLFSALLLLVHLSLDLLPLLPQPLSIPSLSSVLSPLLGIGGSISFKTHVKGTVCRFQRPLCPAFLPLNLVSPKHFPIAWPSRPLFSQLPLSSHLPLPLILPTVLNTFFLKTICVPLVY